MINFNACVIEIEPRNRYRVIIEGVCRTTFIGSGYEYALGSIIECMLSPDYEYVEIGRGVSSKGRRYRKYDVSVDDGDVF